MGPSNGMLDILADPEIGDLDLPIRVHEDVFGFDISMNGMPNSVNMVES